MPVHIKTLLLVQYRCKYVKSFIPLLHVMFRSKQASGKIAGVQSLGVLLLLLIYSAGSIELQSIHYLLHDHAAVHSSEAEKDPCHRAIYHHEKDGCHHASHVSQSKKCPLCQFSFHADQWVSAEGSAQPVHFTKASKKNIALSLIASSPAQQSSRAPPAL